MTAVRRWGTAARLASFLGLVLVLVLGLGLLGLLRAFSSQTQATTARSLVAELKAFATAAGGRPSGETLGAFSESYLRTRVLPDGEVVVVAITNETMVGSSGSESLLRTTTLRRWIAAPPTHGVQRQIAAGGREYLLAATPVVESGRVVATVVAGADLAPTRHDLSRVRSLVLFEGAIAVLAGVAGGYLLLRRLLGRIGRITSTAADIGSGALDRRLRETEAGDEVGQLATTFDAMADALSAAMTTQRRLLSDVSHQLRTPLTVARGHLEVLQRTDVGDPDEVRATIALVLDEIDHMNALVERLLLLGHALEPDFLDREPVDLRSFCTDLMESARVIAARNWVESPVPDLVVDVDSAKVRGALLNLIDNAVHVTGPSDTISLVAERADGRVVLAVEDSGPGIPPERRDAVLERFARPGAADSEGSGLGLAIARAVAEAHGGELTIGESRYGGARVALSLPVVETAPPEPEPAAVTEATCVS